MEKKHPEQQNCHVGTVASAVLCSFISLYIVYVYYQPWFHSMNIPCQFDSHRFTAEPVGAKTE